MSLLKTPKKRRSRSQLASAIALANRVTRGCDLCDITHKCGGVVHTKDPIQKLKIGITDTDYICQCGVCKRKFQDPTIPVPGHSDLVLPGFSCLSSMVVYAFICTHDHCKMAVKYADSWCKDGHSQIHQKSFRQWPWSTAQRPYQTCHPGGVDKWTESEKVTGIPRVPLDKDFPDLRTSRKGWFANA